MPARRLRPSSAVSVLAGLFLFIPGAHAQESTGGASLPAARGSIEGGLPLRDIRSKSSNSPLAEKFLSNDGAFSLPEKLEGIRRDIRVAAPKKPRSAEDLIHLDPLIVARNPFKRDWESMPIGNRAGEQAVNQLAAKPDEIMAGIRAQASPADNLCSQAADQMNGSQRLTDYLAGYRDSADLTAEERVLIEQFAGQCFSSPFNQLGDPEIAAIAARAAVLEIDRANSDNSLPRNPQYCSALFIDSSRVATARHCLFAGKIPIPQAWIKVIAIGPQVRELTRASPTIDAAYRTKGGDSGWDRNAAEDFVVLNVDQAPFSIVPLGFASEDDLRSAGGFLQVGYQHVISLLGQKSPRTLDDFRTAYRLDNSKFCLAIHIAATCLVQGCQSVAQTSGAAFLVRRDGTLKLAATLYGASGGLSPEVKGCFPANANGEAARSINVSSRAR